MFTDHNMDDFFKPQLLIVANLLLDRLTVVEASCANIPVISFCDKEALLKNVHLAITCNFKGFHKVFLINVLFSSA